MTASMRPTNMDTRVAIGRHDITLKQGALAVFTAGALLSALAPCFCAILVVMTIIIPLHLDRHHVPHERRGGHRGRRGDFGGGGGFGAFGIGGGGGGGGGARRGGFGGAKHGGFGTKPSFGAKPCGGGFGAKPCGGFGATGTAQARGFAGTRHGTFQVSAIEGSSAAGRGHAAQTAGQCASHTITAMPEYNADSLEELRIADCGFTCPMPVASAAHPGGGR